MHNETDNVRRLNRAVNFENGHNRIKQGWYQDQQASTSTPQNTIIIIIVLPHITSFLRAF